MYKLSNINVYDIHLNKINPFDISKPCINITKSEVLFEKYRMTLNWDKYYIEVRDDDTMKCNRIFFDFMQRTFSCLDELYMDEICFDRY